MKLKASSRKPSFFKLITDNIGGIGTFALLAGMFIFIFVSKCHYDNTTVEAYLSKYDFENARKAAQELSDGRSSMWDGHTTTYTYQDSDKAKTKFLIISQEAAYYIKNKQYEKALQTADEIFSLFSNYQHSPDPDKSYDDIVNKIINALIRDSDFDYAKKIVVSFKSSDERTNALEKIKQIETQK
jgi:hypothetical protein